MTMLSEIEKNIFVDNHHDLLMRADFEMFLIEISAGKHSPKSFEMTWKQSTFQSISKFGAKERKLMMIMMSLEGHLHITYTSFKSHLYIDLIYKLFFDIHKIGDVSLKKATS